MRRLSFVAGIALLTAFSGVASNTYMEAPANADPKVVNPDSTGFKFKDIKVLPTTSVKDQNKSGTCWAFSGISTLEEDLLSKGVKDIDLSEMFVVRNAYIDKAKKYMRTGGKINFAQGGSFEDVLEMTKLYGAMPESVYSGLNYGEDKHSHYELAGALKAYLDAVMSQGNRTKKLSTAWLPGFIGILDAYFGEVPEKFEYNGKTYTPKEFAAAVGLEPEKFMSITSFTHHPFYEAFPLEISDNWQWSESMNVPMEEMKQIVDYALDHGYTVSWGADVSEGGFKWREGYAILPADKDIKDMTDSEVARWTKLSDSDRDNAKFKQKGPVKEETVTQETRQKGFDNFQTTDDHGMAIVGVAEDQEGNRYYKVKNSWDTNQVYDGYLYVSEPYFLAKTITIGVNEDAVPKDIKKKFKK